MHGVSFWYDENNTIGLTICKVIKQAVQSSSGNLLVVTKLTPLLLSLPSGAAHERYFCKSISCSILKVSGENKYLVF